MCNVSDSKKKIVKSVGTETPDGKVIKSVREGESYKYLRVLEADRFFGEGDEAESL